MQAPLPLSKIAETTAGRAGSGRLGELCLAVGVGQGLNLVMMVVPLSAADLS